jgi:hypothetical protein
VRVCGGTQLANSCSGHTRGAHLVASMGVKAALSLSPAPAPAPAPASPAPSMRAEKGSTAGEEPSPSPSPSAEGRVITANESHSCEAKTCQDSQHKASTEGERVGSNTRAKAFP